MASSQLRRKMKWDAAASAPTKSTANGILEARSAYSPTPNAIAQSRV
jgi:hypothetical protein